MKLFYNKNIFLLTGLFLLMGLISAFTLIACFQYSSSHSSQVVINEVCSNNFNGTADENGVFSDYIELYNPSSEAVSLTDYFLSDDLGKLKKYSLASIVIPPGAYSLIWLNKAKDTAAGQEGFQISKKGEEIFLCMGALEDTVVDSVVVPKLSYNTAYGRIKDGGKEWGEMIPTAGSSNNNARLLPALKLKEPTFSAESGFYEEAFPLTLTASKNEVIYYTLDGSDPLRRDMGNEGVGNQYQGPLLIDDASKRNNIYAARTDLSPTFTYVPDFKVDKATVVRAVSYNDQEKTVSKTVTKVYFVGFSSKKEYEDLPIISIVTDPFHLFDKETGIYGNGKKLEEYKENGGQSGEELRNSFTDEEGNSHYLYEASNAFYDGRKWEKEAAITWFDENHKYGFSQNAGIRIAGTSTRATPKKSFHLYGRDIYDKTITFPQNFFPEMEYSAIKLRNGGNNNNKAMITDAFLSTLAADRKISIQRAKPCITFLNGEYWGLYHIREPYNSEYFKNHYGIPEDHIWLINRKQAQIGEQQAQEAYQYLIDVISECDSSADDVYEMICGIMDVQSLLDFLCIQLYVDNQDVDFGQNTALWRTAETGESPYEDGKWRWMLYDMDVALHPDSNNKPLTWMREHALWNEPVIKSLMKNAQFRKQFCITFMDIANTVYSYQTVHEMLMKWKEIYTTQMVKSHQRFFEEDFAAKDYENYLEEMDTFFKQRFSFAMKSLAEEFGLSGSQERITIRKNLPEAGTVTVNTGVTGDGSTWSGIYFTDFPVLLTATAKEGYRFVRWSGDVSAQESQIEVAIPEGGLSVTAVYEAEK